MSDGNGEAARLAARRQAFETAVHDPAFQDACQRYAHGNGSRGAILQTAVNAFEGWQETWRKTRARAALVEAAARDIHFLEAYRHIRAGNDKPELILGTAVLAYEDAIARQAGGASTLPTRQAMEAAEQDEFGAAVPGHGGQADAVAAKSYPPADTWIANNAAITRWTPIVETIEVLDRPDGKLISIRRRGETLLETTLPAAAAMHLAARLCSDAAFIPAGFLAMLNALRAWAGKHEGQPRDPADAELLKVLWTFDGHKITQCPDCDGECDEPCRPATVAEAHASLDAFIARWNEREERRRTARDANIAKAPRL